MDLYSPAVKQVIASNQRTDSFTSLGLLRLPHGYLGVAPPLSSRLFLPRIMIRANNYQGIPLRYREAAEEVQHGDVTAGVKRTWNVITADKYSFFHS